MEELMLFGVQGREWMFKLETPVTLIESEQFLFSRCPEENN